jgi:hypothetical protein
MRWNCAAAQRSLSARHSSSHDLDLSIAHAVGYKNEPCSFIYPSATWTVPTRKETPVSVKILDLGLYNRLSIALGSARRQLKSPIGST